MFGLTRGSLKCIVREVQKDAADWSTQLNTDNAGNLMHKRRGTAKHFFCSIINVIQLSTGGCLLPRKTEKCIQEHLKFNIPYHKFKNTSETSRSKSSNSLM